jgi:hypothetical protein
VTNRSNPRASDSLPSLGTTPARALSYTVHTQSRVPFITRSVDGNDESFKTIIGHLVA